MKTDENHLKLEENLTSEHANPPKTRGNIVSKPPHPIKPEENRGTPLKTQGRTLNSESLEGAGGRGAAFRIFFNVAKPIHL